MDRGKRESIQKIEALIKLENVKYAAYLKDLLMVVKELDAIPPRFLKQIRAINKKISKQIYKNLLLIFHLNI